MQFRFYNHQRGLKFLIYSLFFADKSLCLSGKRACFKLEEVF